MLQVFFLLLHEFMKRTNDVTYARFSFVLSSSLLLPKIIILSIYYCKKENKKTMHFICYFEISIGS